MPNTPLRILLLGGTSEASTLCTSLAEHRGIAATLSLAGRTANPAASALPVRIGGFGGCDGLAGYLRRERIDLLIDATHPFAARISANAVTASAAAGVELLAIERPPWTRVAGDDWVEHESIAAAIAALPDEPQDVFSGLGRQAIDALKLAPQHRYLIRVVDALEPPADLPHSTVIVSRGPFRTEDDMNLFRRHGIRRVLAKNAGGRAAYAKIEAARNLGLRVDMVRRPPMPARMMVASAEEAMAWIEARHFPRSVLGV